MSGEKFVRVTSLEEIGPEGMRVVVSEEELLLVKKGSEVFAIAYLCSHRDEALEGGNALEDASWVCPHHGARFDLATGRALSMPAVESVKTYSVKLKGNDVYVEDPSR